MTVRFNLCNRSIKPFIRKWQQHPGAIDDPFQRMLSILQHSMKWFRSVLPARKNHSLENRFISCMKLSELFRLLVSLSGVMQQIKLNWLKSTVPDHLNAHSTKWVFICDEKV